jgi:hypothetical protein
MICETSTKIKTITKQQFKFILLKIAKIDFTLKGKLVAVESHGSNNRRERREGSCACVRDDFDKINLNLVLKHEITFSRKDFTK